MHSRCADVPRIIAGAYSAPPLPVAIELNSFRAIKSTLVGAGEAGLTQCIGIDHESGKAGGSRGGQLQFLYFQRVDGEVVAMGFVTCRWARTAPARGAEIRGNVCRTRWQRG